MWCSLCTWLYFSSTFPLSNGTKYHISEILWNKINICFFLIHPNFSMLNSKSQCKKYQSAEYGCFPAGSVLFPLPPKKNDNEVSLCCIRVPIHKKLVSMRNLYIMTMACYRREKWEAVYPQLSKPTTTTQLKGKNSQTLVKISARTEVIKFRAWKMLVSYHKKIERWFVTSIQRILYIDYRHKLSKACE